MLKGVLCTPRTDRQSHTKVNTENTLSGFQEFSLQPIIKDRSKIRVIDITVLSLNRVRVWRIISDMKLKAPS